MELKRNKENKASAAFSAGAGSTSSLLLIGLACLACLATRASGASTGDQASGLGGSMLVSSLMNYFNPSQLSAVAGEPSKMLANWSPNDDSRKQQVLRDLISKASVLIENYQSNGLRNVPSLPMNIPGVGAVMKTPDKLLRAELSMMQDLIKMSQKMIQNPLSATMEFPMDLAVLMSRTALQIEQ